MGLLLSSVVCHAGQNVVVILDDSGSMNERMRGQRTTKMVAAKEALLTVLDQLPDDARVGVVLLNGSFSNNTWPVPLGPINRQATRRAIERISAGGGTPLGEYMKVGTDALLELRDQEHYGTYRLLIVSDGDASDPHLVDQYLPDLLATGITTDVIGVDMRGDHSLATRVHSYRRADDPAALTKAVMEVFAETSTDTSPEGESDFELLQGLPAPVAAEALAALTRSGNTKIGERNQQSGELRNDAGQGGASGGNPGMPKQPPKWPSMERYLWFLFFIIIVWRILFSGKAKRKPYRR